jgi:hypothetical protein
VNQEVLLRATFLGWSAGLFFAWGWVMNGVPLASGHRHVEGQGHDQDQLVEAVGVAEMGILDAEAARFEIREHRLDTPAIGILKGAQVAGFFRHRDDPGLGMARIVDDADVGARPPAGEVGVFQVVDPVAGALSGRRLVSAVEHDEIALQPQAIIPVALLAPADQIGRAVEAVAHQPDPGLPGQPGNHRVQQRLLGLEPDRALGLLDPPRQRQGALTAA